MNKLSIKIAFFAICVVAAFVTLSILSTRSGLSGRTFDNALRQAEAIDAAMKADEPDWTAVKREYKGAVVAFIKDTRRFAPNANLNNKIEESLEAGADGLAPAIQAIIIRRTLLRASLYHLEALLHVTAKAELRLEADERRRRAAALYQWVEAFAQERAPDQKAALGAAFDAWANTSEETAGQKAIGGIHRMLAMVILDELAEWRDQMTKSAKGKEKAIWLQADMRQLFYVIYPELYDSHGQDAWTVLTEFTNQPGKMNADGIEKMIRSYLEGVNSGGN